MHRNARLTEWGRQELVRRVEAGTPAATVARQMNVSRDTVYKWWRRAQTDPQGRWWLDRSSRPHRSPTKTRRKLERKILSLRRNKKLGPGRIAGRLERTDRDREAYLAVDAELIGADGAASSINLTAAPLVDANDAVIGSMLVMEDITSEKRVRSTMARYMSKEGADQLLRLRCAEQALGRGVHERDLALADDHQRVGAKFDEPPVTFLALA